MYIQEINKTYMWLCIYELCIFLCGAAAALVFSDQNLVMLLSVTVSFAAVFIFNRKSFAPLSSLWVSEKRMSPGLFLVGLSALCLTQLFAAGVSAAFGSEIPVAAANVEASGSGISLWGIVYAGLIGPAAEEILFRGFLAGTVRKYSKAAAVILSAVSFSLIHGSPESVISALPAGILLGYLAVNYSVAGSFAFHVISNIFFSILPKLAGSAGAVILPEIVWLGLTVSSIPFILVMIVNRKQAAEEIGAMRNGTGIISARQLIRTPWLIVFNGVLLASMILGEFNF